MSHGDFKNGKQILILYDQEVPAESLWKPFLGNTCTTLAGKPKMFFIQVGLRLIDAGIDIVVQKYIKCVTNVTIFDSCLMKSGLFVITTLGVRNT